MIQQGANLFNEGLNLDTNPIAIDNHTLTGALNATMVTMNGNELVLQNDMGNAKVDQAQLPLGYVPVGVKEHGGIVYVASYNPIKGECLLGSFPSPQRNFASDESGRGFRLEEIWDFIKRDVKQPIDMNKAVEIGGNYYIDITTDNLERYPSGIIRTVQIATSGRIGTSDCAVYRLVSSDEPYSSTQSYFTLRLVTSGLITYDEYVYEPNPDINNLTNYYIHTFPEYINLGRLLRSNDELLQSNLTWYTRSRNGMRLVDITSGSISSLNSYYVRSADVIYYNTGNWIENSYKYVTLIGDNDEDIVRTGDRFVIGSDSAYDVDRAVGYNYMKLLAMILASDNTSVDITPDLIPVLNPVYNNLPFLYCNPNGDFPRNEEYSIHKNKVSGLLILKESLVLPSHINVSVKAEPGSDNTHVKLKFKPQAYDINGNPWMLIDSSGNISTENNRLAGYAIKINRVNTLTDSNEFIECLYGQSITNDGYLDLSGITWLPAEYDINDILIYEIYPLYDYDTLRGLSGIYAKVKSLGRTNTIKVGDVGSGRVNFGGYFKYYNNFVADRFLLDFTINAYIDGSDYSLLRLYLQMFDVEDLFLNYTSPIVKNPKAISDGLVVNSDIQNSVYQDLYRIEIPLSTDTYFGNASALITYDLNILPASSVLNPASNIDKGHYYIGRLVAETEVGRYTSEWYGIITSRITELLYADTSVEAMIKLKDISTNHIFELATEVDYERNKLSSLENILELGDRTSIFIDNPPRRNNFHPATDWAIEARTIKKGYVEYEHKVLLKIPQSFDYDLSYYLPFNINPDDVYAHNCTFDFVYLRNRYGTLTFSEILKSGSLSNCSNKMRNLLNRSLRDYPVYFNRTVDNDGGATFTGSLDSWKISYSLPSIFDAALVPNNNALAGSNDINDYAHTFNRTLGAFVPYMPLYNTLNSADLRKFALGPLTEIKTEGFTNNDWIADPAAIINHRIKEVKGYSGIRYRRYKDSDWKYVIRLGDYNNTWYNIVDSGVDSVPEWGNACNIIQSKFRELGYQPTFMFWEGSDWGYGEHLTLNNRWEDIYYRPDWEVVVNYAVAGSIPLRSRYTAGYSIPLMLGTDNNYYPIDQFYDFLGDKKDAIKGIIKAFNSIYVYLPSQNVHFIYYKGSNEDSRYVYNLDYNATINYKTKFQISSYYYRTNVKKVDLRTHEDNIALYDKYKGDAVEFLGELNYKLPLFTVEASTEDKEWEEIINSPDQSILIAEMLSDTTIEDLKGAIIMDSEGETFIQKAVIMPKSDNSHDIMYEDYYKNCDSVTDIWGVTYPQHYNNMYGDYTYRKVDFDEGHIYLHVRGKGADAQLIDCQDPANYEAIQEFHSRLRKNLVLPNLNTWFRRGNLIIDVRTGADKFGLKDGINYGEIINLDPLNARSQPYDEFWTYCDWHEWAFPYSFRKIGRFGLNIAKAIYNGFIKVHTTEGGYKQLRLDTNATPRILNLNQGTRYKIGNNGNHCTALSTLMWIYNLPIIDDDLIGWKFYPLIGSSHNLYHFHLSMWPPTNWWDIGANVNYFVSDKRLPLLSGARTIDGFVGLLTDNILDPIWDETILPATANTQDTLLPHPYNLNAHNTRSVLRSGSWTVNTNWRPQR